MLQMSGALEIQAAKLRRDALRMLLGTVSGTVTSNLWKLLEHFFGVDEDPEETQAMEASSLSHLLCLQCKEHKKDKAAAMEAIQKGAVESSDIPSSSQPAPDPPTPLTEAAKQKTTLKEQKQLVLTEDSYPNKCSLEEAQLFFPMNEDQMHQTEVPDSLTGERIKLRGYKACYPCMSEGCQYVAQTRGILCSHARHVHLGITLGCRMCPEEHWWQARYWSEHMEKCHPDLPKFQVITSGPNVIKTDPEMYISKETIIVPAPGEQPSVKVEIPDTTQEEEDEAVIAPKRSMFTQEQQLSIESGAEYLIADPPASHPHQPCPRISGI